MEAALQEQQSLVAWDLQSYWQHCMAAIIIEKNLTSL